MGQQLNADKICNPEATLESEATYNEVELEETLDEAKTDVAESMKEEKSKVEPKIEPWSTRWSRFLYGRLFPSTSLHLMHHSSGLHWLPKVLYGVENNKWNGIDKDVEVANEATDGESHDALEPRVEL
ncbi:hypothetical protein PTKIN_Ptkin11bG0132700 [Pterospermum kingtungense]